MDHISIIKRLYKNYSKKFIKRIIFSGFFAILVAASTSSIAWLLDPAIKKLFIEKDLTLIFFIPILIIIAFTTKGASLYFAKTIMIGVAEEIKKMLQMDMINSLIKADTDLIDKKHTGKFISNLTYDVNLITNILSNGILNIFKDSLTLIGLLFVMFYQNWKLSLIALIMIPLSALVTRTLGKRIKKVSTEAQQSSGLLNVYLVEIFKNHKLIKIFQKENFEKNRSEKFIESLKEKNKKIAIVNVRSTPFMEFLTGIMIAILIYFSGRLIINNEIDINNFFSFLAAMMLAYQPVRSLATITIAYNQGMSAANRILPIIDTKNQIADSSNSKDINIKDAQVEFKNVDFSYASKERQVLKSVNLNIKGGKMTALVGHSGSGKSTILNLIPRFYNIQKGDILIDNQSIYNAKIFSLRNNISMVSQDTTLFDDTVKNNISYANPNTSHEEIIEAVKLSHSHDFIEKLPNKIDTIIGENGVRLSGGEKQRISIARAMIKKSSIILLDEATSSLDSETEEKIQSALNLLTKNKTTLVIAHRLSTILSSERIYVVDDGKIVANGKHEDLLNTSDVYKKFYEKQLQK
jgi:subfamily B ATP-binding cassette protein MsbA|tara:strand:- start:5395 stop:7131 length:1737 start_codon:yes stop_codon:yes gene_type:complete